MMRTALPCLVLLLSTASFAQTSFTNGNNNGNCSTSTPYDYYCVAIPANDGGWIQFFVPTRSGDFINGSFWKYAVDGSIEINA